MTMPEALSTAPRTRALPSGMGRAPGSTRGLGPTPSRIGRASVAASPRSRGHSAAAFDGPFDPGTLALWDEGLRRLRSPS
jgi:hypothetical protein